MQSRSTINKTNQRQPVGRSPNKTAARPGYQAQGKAKAPPKKEEKKEEKKPDTRTAEEIDASYRKNCELFEKAKAGFENSFARKLVEFAAAYGCQESIGEETMQRAV